jgi:ribosome-associated toxin RatA of RatAB toxin-antitoxin module
MVRSRRVRRGLSLLTLALALGACRERGVDWNAPGNLLLREQSAKTDDGVRLEYWSLVDAPAQAVYDALADLEHYPDFIPGVDRLQVLGVDGNTKTVQIAQRVIGRQSNAKVEWTFIPERRRIEFHTAQSDLSYNDGSYDIEPSPDGKRCLVHSVFLVREGQGRAQGVPIGVLVSGTRESFLGAARGVQQRAARPAG